MKSVTKDLGKIMMTMEGEYNSEREYEILSVVSFEDISYISKKNVPINIPVTNKEYWQFFGSLGNTPKLRKNIETEYIEVSYDNGEHWKQLIALSEITGPQGIQGIQGPKGEPAVAIENYITVEATLETIDIADILPSVGSADTVYRVSNWDGIQYNETTYSEYGWYNNTYKKLATRQTGIDNEPIINSQNLVKSGGVATQISRLGQEMLGCVPVHSSTELFDRSTTIFKTDLNSSTGAEVPSATYNCSPFIPMDNNTKIWLTAYGNIAYVYDSSKNYLGRIVVPAGSSLGDVNGSFTNAAYIRIIFNNAMINTARVGLTEKENLVKDYFDYDDTLTKGSDALVTSGVLFEKIVDSTKLVKGTNSYNLSAGRKYDIMNTGSVTVNVFYKVSPSSEEVAIVNNLAPNGHVCFNAQVNSTQIVISNIDNAEITILDPDSIDGQLFNMRDDLNKVIDDLSIKESTQDLYGGDNNYNTVVGESYIFENTGSATVSVYYQIDAQSADVSIYQDLHVGESFEYRPVVNAGIIDISNATGAKVTVTRIQVGSILGRIISLEEEQENTPTLIRVATFNVGDYTGKNLVIGTEEAKLAYRKLIGELGASIIGTQEDVANYDGENIKDAFWLMFKNYNRKGNTNYNYKAFASDYNITNIRQIAYTGQYSYDHYYFLAGKLIIKDKTILVISFHFDWSNNDTRHEQIRQVIAFASNYENVIMMGDTNCENYINRVAQEPRNLCDVEWPIFSKAGYEMANGAYFGWFDTVGYDEETQSPLDNIFVKGDIIIRNAGTIVKDWTNDHCVLYADLAIY